MKFRSPTETPIHLSLTSGHTCVIGAELVEVEPRFHRLAVAEGAIPEGMDAVAPSAGSEPTKRELILAAMRAMVEEAKPEDFTNDGRPNASVLAARVGFTVPRDEREAAWEAVSED